MPPSENFLKYLSVTKQHNYVVVIGRYRWLGRLPQAWWVLVSNDNILLGLRE